MTTNELRTTLEQELAWRQEELAFFQNQLNNFSSEDDRNRYRKSLVLVLYSHMEGYIKICLLTYVQYINDLGLPRREVSYNLMAAGMHKEFRAYETFDMNNEVFRNSLPNDTALRRFSRRVDFMEQVEEFKDANLSIPDQIVDTESNLRYDVLQKNLYKIGLQEGTFEVHKKAIDSLVNRRNGIAHGNSRSGVEEHEFEEWKTITLRILSDITRLIYNYAVNERYLR